MRRKALLTMAVLIVTLSGCSLQRRPRRRPPPTPPPADVDYVVDVLPVIVGPVGGTSRWTQIRLAASLASVAPALAEARILPTFLEPVYVDGPAQLEIGSTEMVELQRAAWLDSGSVLQVHFVEELVRDGTGWGGVAYMPYNKFGPSQHGVFVSSFSVPSTTAHEICHHLGLPHANEDDGLLPPVPPVCADIRECDRPQCARDLMSYCTSEREPTGPHSLNPPQEGRARYWAAVLRAFRAVSAAALRTEAMIRPEFTELTAPVVCGG